MDSFGRRPVLVVGCLLSSVARSFIAKNPKSDNWYVLYRVLNVNTLMPVMQASNAYLMDHCGGRNSNFFIKVHRRLFMLLALVRIICTRVVVKKMRDGVRPEMLMLWASYLTLAASVIFSMYVPETLHDRKSFSVSSAWSSSMSFFLKSRMRALVAVALILRMLPQFSVSTMTALEKYTFKWEYPERARFSNIVDVAEIACPFVMNELFKIPPIKGKTALIWGSRFNAFALFNVGLTPWSATLFINPIIERLVNTQLFFNEILTRYRGDLGEGAIETAISTLEFPVGLIAPKLFTNFSEIVGNRTLFVVLGLLTLINSEIISASF